ncbi:MAG: hypothetical protein H6595_12970 [Flavobacteriales bacterium]|nr:hypothetical protein [Flavobacteriales bacterium]MCB9168376.1 hypothetical protein [Flavobacteriales bacterium]
MTRNTLITGLALLALAACRKTENDQGVAPTPTLHALTSVFADNVANATQSFSVSAATGGVVQGADGTRILFGPGAFRDAQGNAVTGTVDVGLVEVLTIADMLWLNKQTVGMQNGQRAFLKSGGELRLTAEQGGASLRLAPGATSVSVPYTAAPDPNMQLFLAQPDANGTLVWNPFGNGPVPLDTIGYLFPNDTLDWINVDQFANWTGTRTDVEITMPADYLFQNTKLWVVFPSTNSVADVYTFDNGSFTLTGNYQLPVGLDVHFVALHDAGNDTFTSAFASLTVTSGLALTLTFAPTTLLQWQADCNAL